MFLIDSNAVPCSVEAGRLHKHYEPGRSARQSTPLLHGKMGTATIALVEPDQTGLAGPDVGFSKLPALRHQRQDTALVQGSYGSIDRAGREPEVQG